MVTREVELRFHGFASAYTVEFLLHELIGLKEFDIGEKSGWVLRFGHSLHLCGDELVNDGAHAWFVDLLVDIYCKKKNRGGDARLEIKRRENCIQIILEPILVRFEWL